MSFMLPLSSRTFAALAVSLHLLLVGCGGGGGGGAGGGGAVSSPTPSNPATMLLSQFNTSQLTQQVTGDTELVMTTGHFAGELAQRFSRKGDPLTYTENCPDRSGKLTITLTDRDGDGIASAGDRVAATFDQCRLGMFGDNIAGSLVLELAAPTSLATGSINGLVQLDGNLALPFFKRTLSGSFNVAMTRSAVGATWKVTSSGADNVSLVTGTAPAISLRSLALAKTVDYEQARNTVDITLRYITQDGIGVVSTPTPFTGYIQRAPDSGVLELKGTNGSVKVRAAKVNNKVEAQLQRIWESGTVEFLSAWSWMGLTRGIFWWDGQSRDPSTQQPDLDTKEYATDFLNYRLLAPAPAAITDPAAGFRLQFLRPPVDLPQLVYRFQDVRSLDFSSPLVDVAASAERHGALLLIRPAQSLRHGHEYLLQASADGTTWSISGKFNAPDILLHDAEGHDAKIMYGNVGNAWTPDTLRAGIETDFDSLSTATELVQLTATTRPSTGRTIVRYRWSQLNGTPLLFTSQDTAVSALAWGSSVPSGIEAIQVQLEVTDSAGQTEYTRRTIGVGNVAAQPEFMVLRGDDLVPFRQRKTVYAVTRDDDAIFEPGYQPGLLKRSLSSLDRNLQRNWRLTVSNPGAAPLQVGTYAFAGGELASPSSPDMIFQDMAVWLCTTRVGKFTVLEIAWGPNGAPTRLAVDFESSCNGAPAVYGSYRFNSAVPPRP